MLPFSVGAHAAMAGAFRILDFDDPDDPDVVYLESHVGALYLEEQHEVDGVPPDLRAGPRVGAVGEF